MPMKDFLKGAVFMSIILPIISGLVSLFNQAIDFFCTAIAVKTANLQTKLPQEPESTNVIGFQMPEEYYYKDEDEGE
jgi:hypothetical protein